MNVSINFSPQTIEEFERAVACLAQYRFNGSAQVSQPDKRDYSNKGPYEREYYEKFGKNLRLGKNDMGRNREDVARERLNAGQAGESEDSVERDKDLDEDPLG